MRTQHRRGISQRPADLFAGHVTMLEVLDEWINWKTFSSCHTPVLLGGLQVRSDAIQSVGSFEIAQRFEPHYSWAPAEQTTTWNAHHKDRVHRPEKCGLYIVVLHTMGTKAALGYRASFHLRFSTSLSNHSTTRDYIGGRCLANNAASCFHCYGRDCKRRHATKIKAQKILIP